MDPFYLALFLYLSAAVLAFVDLFVPSGGILMIMGVAAALASILFGFRSGTNMGMLMLTIVAASVPAFAFAAIQIWPRTPIGRRIILGAPAQDKHKHASDNHRESLIGSVVLTEYPLMPAGQICVAGRRFNAISQSGIIESGQKVKIVAVKERNLIVHPTSAALTDFENGMGGQSTGEMVEENSEKLLERPADELGFDSLD